MLFDMNNTQPLAKTQSPFLLAYHHIVNSNYPVQICPLNFLRHISAFPHSLFVMTYSFLQAQARLYFFSNKPIFPVKQTYRPGQSHEALYDLFNVPRFEQVDCLEDVLLRYAVSLQPTHTSLQTDDSAHEHISRMNVYERGWGWGGGIVFHPFCLSASVQVSFYCLRR